jgi:hypothetical protein
MEGSQLTKEDGQLFLLFDQFVQHLLGDVFDVIFLEQVRQPLENFLFHRQVTGVDDGDTFTEEDQGGQSLDAVLLSFDQTVDPDELDVLLVAFVVDILQFGQDLDVVQVVLVIWKRICRVSIVRSEVMSLTEEHGEVLLLVDEFVQYFVGNFFDLVVLQLMEQPLQEFFFVQQIA